MTTIEEAVKLRERRDDAYGSLTQVFAKTDLPRLRRTSWAWNITDAGGSIFVVREARTYDDAEEAAQSIEMTFRALTDETYRVEVSKKTRRSLGYLAQNEVPLGRKPELTDADLAKIRALHDRGLGYTAIGIVMAKVQKKDGKVINRSAETIKRALSGEYESREAYERRSREARQRMAARAVLGLETTKEKN
ncbi:hypothetical protein [Curtobacterium sp. SL109]|uniref:hypothetical protein n=1 Tax=Curtobacterium sp. SL109 TaxID=2994662 RepID=UPI00227565FC|nr:hypothetical protein [Curtobacterium sp. SL109]MCY1696478.1 hypothetical protein [Curtobacterium sp. SL109]